MSNPIGKPGYTGNPGGRPKMPPELREAIQGHSAKAVEVLASILADPAAKAADRIRAAEVLLARAWGLPVQAVEDLTPARRAIVYQGMDVDEVKAKGGMLTPEGWAWFPSPGDGELPDTSDPIVFSGALARLVQCSPIVYDAAYAADDIVAS